ncbi:MAG: DUF2461 domain-containing protein, partial [Pseudomonadota bacterium]
PGFLGFGPSTFTWFKGLERHNEKAWFDANRKTFEAEIRGPLSALLDEFASRHGGKVKIFRLNRDVRFSKDKSPYKTNNAGFISRDGALGFYASVSSAGMQCGAGVYDPSKERLAALRAAIADDETGPELEAALDIARAAGVEVRGAAVATAPRGYAKDHPRIALLRLKQIFLSRQLGPTETLDGRRPFDFALETWKATAPARDWLEAHAPA